MNTVCLTIRYPLYYGPHHINPQAHHHAANADDYLIKGLIVLASQEHFKAAEAYIAAIDRSHDESVQQIYNFFCPLNLIPNVL